MNTLVTRIKILGAAALLLAGVAAQQSQASQILSVQSGSVVDPTIVNVVLTRGDKLTVDINVQSQPLAQTNVDVFLLEDLSGSFFDDVSTLRTLAPSLVSDIQNAVGTARFGVGSFVDKPVSPFGSASTADYEYQTNLAVTSSATAFQNTINSLSTKWGGDLPESQLTALLQTALRAETEVGFSSGAKKVVVLSTDAGFHQAGDFAGAPANNGDAVADVNEDYPEIGQVGQALIEAGIVPIFAVTSPNIAEYQALVDQFGFGAVVALSTDSSNLTNAILEGISELQTEIAVFLNSDEFGFAVDLNPEVLTGLVPGETGTFQLDLLWDGVTGMDDTLFLDFPGFGSTQVNITLVSAPGQVALLAVALAVIGWRRRRV